MKWSDLKYLLFPEGLCVAMLIIGGTILVAQQKPATPAPATVATVSEEVLQLKAQLEQAKTDLAQQALAAARCDAAWADTRAKLATVQLTGEMQAREAGRAALEQLAKDNGLQIAWPDPAKGQTDVAVKKADPPAPAKDESKK